MNHPRSRLAAILATVLVIGVVFGLIPHRARAAGGDESLSRTVTVMVQHTRDARAALVRGDPTTARADGEALEATWKSVESAVVQRSPTSEKIVDADLDAANAALAGNPPAADAAQRLTRLEQDLTVLQVSLSSSHSAVPTGDSIALGQQVRRLQDVDAALGRGDLAAASTVLTAFKTEWPNVEPTVAARSDSAYRLVEDQTAVAREALSARPPDVPRARAAVGAMIDALQPLLGSEAHYTAFDSAVTVLREGLEGLLIISALLALVSRAGRPDLRTRVWAGAAAGVVASLILAVVLQIVFGRFAGGTNREFLEGITGLVAAVMLLAVSYWMHGQSQLADWRKFIASNAGRALTSGRGLALVTIAFLSVFREGGETTLMYLGMAASISLSDLLLGMALGIAGLVVLGLAIFGFGVRLSLKPFFRVMSVLLYYLAFKFVGTGIHALQVVGTLPATGAPYLPSLAILGLFPTWQTTLAQVALLAVAFGAVAYLGAIHRQPRRSVTA